MKGRIGVQNLVSRKSVWCPALLLAVLSSTSVGGAERWMVETGEANLQLDAARLGFHGLAVLPVKNGAVIPDSEMIALTLVEESSVDLTLEDGILAGISEGSLRFDEGLSILFGQTSVTIEQAVILPFVMGSSARLIIVDGASTLRSPLLDLDVAKVGFDAQGKSLLWETADVRIAPSLARELGDMQLAGVSIGSMRGKAQFMTGELGAAPGIPALTDIDAVPAFNPDGYVAGGNNGTNCWNAGEPLIGPDVIVGDIIDMSNYPSSGGIDAYAVGTTSCNIGSTNLQWIDNTPNVPVIGQSIYRLKNGRIEQLGQGWLKYAFTALTQNACGCGCNGSGGTVLGVGCSDPYCCGLNGQQGSMGPKYQINAWTGAHPSFPANPGFSGELARRIQVPISEIDPAQNGGGIYFAEAQYITPDDAAAGNHFNNASYRRINFTAGTWNATLAATTQREQPAIRAWQDNDALVSEADVRIPGEGLMILASKVTGPVSGLWHYEWALQNLNSDRSAGSFSVPISDLADVQNIGFHDVLYHSGEITDNTDWTPTRANGAVTWATQTFAQNANANALRWGTLYNFWFDSNAPPSRVGITIGLFKPGSPNSVLASADGPFLCVPAECDDGNPCTDDGCGAVACEHIANSVACNDANDCTINDSCVNGACAGTPTVIIPGDVFPFGGNAILDVDDMICELLSFVDIQLCPGADVYPCPPNGDGIIDVDDLNVVLGAFQQQYICDVPCPP